MNNWFNTKGAINLALLLVLFLFNIIQAQQVENVPGLIEVKFKKGAVTRFDKGLNLESIKNSDLKNYLSNIGFKDCRKIFSNAIEDDTVGINSEGKAFKKIDLSRWYIIKFDNKNSIDSIRKKLLNGNDVEFVCPVVKWKVETEPNDPYYMQGYQTGLKNGTTGRDIHVYDAWNYSTGRSDVKIAVVDAGVDYTHPDLDPGNRSRIITGYDFGDNDDNPMDDIPSQYQAASHGTLVAGVIGAITNNNYGVAGIMQNLRIIPVKVFGTSGPWWDPFSWDPNSSYDPWIANGINYAANNGAKVINLSLGGPGLSGWENLFIGNPVGEATYNAYHQGVLLVAAAGNNGSNAPFYPADFVGVMSVAAVDNNDNRASFSNYGNFISVCAPGNYYENYSTKRGNSFDYFQGTSCSAPMVSGSAGLVMSEALDRGINLTNDDVKHLLEASADKVPGMQGQNWSQYYGYGRINVGRAVERLNPLYSVTTQTVFNSSGTLVWDSHAHQFYNNGGLASGNYYGVKTYKVSGHVTFPQSYNSVPYVWVRDKDCIGWNYANPNLELPWVKITNVTTTGFDYETVIYWIGYNSIGQEINKYWPGNTSTLQAKIVYTAIGVPTPPPPIPPIIAYFTQNPDPLYNGGTGYVYAHLSQGTEPITYSWSETHYPAMTVVLTPNGSSCQVHYYLPYNTSHGIFITCTASNAYGSDTKTYQLHTALYGYGPASLAFVTNGVLTDENPVLVSSVDNPGVDVTDYYLINKEITPENNMVNFLLHETDQTKEHTYLDQVELWEVKANKNEFVAVTEDGEVISYKKLVTPNHIILNNSLDITNILADKDNLKLTVKKSDRIKIKHPGNAEELYSVFYAQLYNSEELSAANNNSSDLYYFRPQSSAVCKKLKVVPSGDIEIAFSKDLVLDYFALVKNERTAKAEKLNLLSAEHSKAGETASLFAAADKQYGDILPGEEIKFKYEAKPNSNNDNTAYILKAVGKYEKAGLLKEGNHETISGLPKETTLYDNYPNPFNPTTNIRYHLKENTLVELTVANSLGQQVEKLVSGYQNAGYYSIAFDGSKLASGIYFYRLQVGNQVFTKKMLLMK